MNLRLSFYFRPIKVAEFHRHVEMMSGNSNMGFSQEFKVFMKIQSLQQKK